MIVLTVLAAFALRSVAVLQTEIADLAGSLESKVLKAEFPRSWTAKLRGKVLKIPKKTINSYDASIIFGFKYNLRLSESFHKTHIEGHPPSTYRGSSLVTGLERADLQLPSDFKDWKYGESRTIPTSNYVKMKQSTRTSKDQEWKGSDTIERIVEFKVTKLKGAKNSAGERDNDVFLIEEITGLKESPSIPPLPKVIPALSRNFISKAIFSSHSFDIGESTNAIVPNVFLNEKIQVIAPVQFIATHFKGNPPDSYFGDKLIKIAELKINFLIPSDLHNLKIGKTVILESNNYIKLEELVRDSVDKPWKLARVIDRQIQVTATIGKIKKSGYDAILIQKLRVIAGPLFDPNVKRLISRPWITTEPAIYGGVKTWVIPKVFIDSAEVRATEDFIKLHYYCIAPPNYLRLHVHVIPDSGITLFRSEFDQMVVGGSGTLHTTNYVFKGEYKRADLNTDDWMYRDTNYYQVGFNAVKYINPDTKQPIVVLNYVQTIKMKP